MTSAICISCRTKFTGSGQRCDACKAKRDAVQPVKVRLPIYGTARWRKLSERKRRMSPLCESCKAKGIIRPADMVDHIHEIADGGAPFDIANTQPLCNSCHGEKTNKARKERLRNGR